MRIKDSIVITKINDEFALVDSDASKDRFNGLVRFNEETKDIIDIMTNNDVTYDDIVTKMLEKYNVDETKLREDIIKIIEKLNGIKIIIN